MSILISNWKIYQLNTYHFKIEKLVEDFGDQIDDENVSSTIAAKEYFKMGCDTKQICCHQKENELKKLCCTEKCNSIDRFDSIRAANSLVSCRLYYFTNLIPPFCYFFILISFLLFLIGGVLKMKTPKQHWEIVNN